MNHLRWGILALLLACGPAWAQVTGNKITAGTVINCADADAPDHAYIFTGASGTTVTDIGCVGGQPLTLTGASVSFQDVATHGRQLRFAGGNNTSYAMNATALGATTDAMIVVVSRINSTSTPAAIQFVAGFGSSAVGPRYAGVGYSQPLGGTDTRIQMRRDDEASTAIVSNFSADDYSDNAFHMMALRVRSNTTGAGFEGGALSVDGANFTCGTNCSGAGDLNTMGFAGIMNRFGIGVQPSVVLDRYAPGDATITLDVSAVFVYANRGYANYSNARVTSIWNTANPYLGVGLTGCSGVPSSIVVDGDNVISSTQQNVAFTMANGCTSGTVTLENAAATKTQAQDSYSATAGQVDISGVGSLTAGNLPYGVLNFCVTNTAAGKTCRTVTVVPGIETAYAFQSAGSVGSGTTTITAGTPGTWPTGAKTVIYTQKRIATEFPTLPTGYVETFASDDEPIALYCHVKELGDTIPALAWSGSAAGKAVAFTFTGGPATCAGLSALISIAPRDQATTTFPYAARTVPEDGSFVFIAGAKDKVAANNCAVTSDCVSPEPNFTQMWDSGTNGTSLITVGNYWIQDSKTNIAAGNWDFVDAANANGGTYSDESASITVAFKGGAPIYFDPPVGGWLLATLAFNPNPNRVYGAPLDLQTTSQIALSDMEGCVGSDVDANDDASLTFGESCTRVKISFTRNGVYVGTPQIWDLTGLPGSCTGLPGQTYASGVAIVPYDIDTFCTAGDSAFVLYGLKRLDTATGTDQANGAGIASQSLVVDDLAGFTVGDWIRVSGAYARIRWINPLTNTLGLSQAITWADNAAVSIMSISDCTVAGLTLDTATGGISGTPSAAETNTLCFARTTDLAGLIADTPQ